MSNGLITLGIPGTLTQVITGGIETGLSGIGNGLITLGIPGTLEQVITSGLEIGIAVPPVGTHNGLITLGIPGTLTQVITSGLEIGIAVPIPTHGGGYVRRLYQQPFTLAKIDEEDDEEALVLAFFAMAELM